MFVVNLDPGGRVHRLAVSSLTLPPRDQKTCCGWRFGRLGGIATKRLRAAAGVKCRKCFAAAGETTVEQEECVEEFE